MGRGRLDLVEFLFAEQNVLILFVFVAFHNFGPLHVTVTNGSKQQVCGLPRTQTRTWDRIRPWPSSTNISASAASTERQNPLALFLPRKGPNPPAKILLSYKSTPPAVCIMTFAWPSMAH